MSVNPAPGVIGPLFAGLVDDAAIFPPGNLPVPEAVAAHRRHRAAWYADLVGAFLISSAKLPELVALADPADPLRVVVVVAGGADGVGPALRTVLDTPGLVLAGAETAGDVAAVIGAYHEHLPEDLSGAIEVVNQDVTRLKADLDLIAATRHRAKFRTGGVTQDAFPSRYALAEFLRECAVRGLPFKLTAGLHNALHHTDPETGLVHYGFLNIVEATASAPAASAVAAGDGRAWESFAGTLTTESEQLAADVRRHQLPHAAEIRALFTGFGSCSVDEPLDDLIALGLVARPQDPKEDRP
ncbi:hypothetical protein [Yinghuangia seranimata]|uniref:hypothetical protein n=1 Tax=Yinghuangia seranimata TaxID=408067 RepID=UPI00248AC84A|nr:hypothetical protein [Yinghuangia seranimata]MDI2125203.1 hypothetical protein [Yinghuangia seranimata]